MKSYPDKWERVSDNGLEPNRDWPVDPEAPAQDQVDVCREWLRLHAEPTKNIRRAAYSYALKHVVEKWVAKSGHHKYVSNGAFIAAALQEGYRAKRATSGSLNARFNMQVRKEKT